VDTVARVELAPNGLRVQAAPTMAREKKLSSTTADAG
jgi:hypothetical protein